MNEERIIIADRGYRQISPLKGRGQKSFGAFCQLEEKPNTGSDTLDSAKTDQSPPYKILVKEDPIGTCFAESTAASIERALATEKSLSSACNFAKMEMMTKGSMKIPVSVQPMVTASTGHILVTLDRLVYGRARNPKAWISDECLHKRKIKKFLQSLPLSAKKQLAAALYTSIAVGDESVHLGQFMVEKDSQTNEVKKIIKIDFGARERFSVARRLADDFNPSHLSKKYRRSGQIGKDYLRYLLQDDDVKREYLNAWRQPLNEEFLKKTIKEDILSTLSNLPDNVSNDTIKEMLKILNKGTPSKFKITANTMEELAEQMSELAFHRIKRMQTSALQSTIKIPSRFEKMIRAIRRSFRSKQRRNWKQAIPNEQPVSIPPESAKVPPAVFYPTVADKEPQTKINDEDTKQKEKLDHQSTKKPNLF